MVKKFQIESGEKKNPKIICPKIPRILKVLVLTLGNFRFSKVPTFGEVNFGGQGVVSVSRGIFVRLMGQLPTCHVTQTTDKRWHAWVVCFMNVWEGCVEEYLSPGHLHSAGSCGTSSTTQKNFDFSNDYLKMPSKLEISVFVWDIFKSAITRIPRNSFHLLENRVCYVHVIVRSHNFLSNFRN